MALIGKWWWRFKTETTSFSTWKEIVKTGNDIEDLGLTFKGSFAKKLGDGASTSFWNDSWLGNVVLKNKFKRLWRLDVNSQATVRDRVHVADSKCVGNWAWSRELTGRTCGELVELNRLLEAATIDPKSSDGWLWTMSNNGLFSTARKKRLPVLFELDKRGVDLNSVRCPLCDGDIESVNHSLILCKQAFDVWCKVFEWWGRSGTPFLQVEDLLSDTGYARSDIGKSIWQAVMWSCSYLIWTNRNQKVFSNKCWNVPVALNEIQRSLVRTFKIYAYTYWQGKKVGVVFTDVAKLRRLGRLVVLVTSPFRFAKNSSKVGKRQKFGSKLVGSTYNWHLE
ncbi:uncharacterized protein [Rutidosis leptorrhynchoides]|uniref:uncharacterized protein n=1 Tax=Rutidosis leptorrhynchoides TaxID=125765 RepID=UPI003A9A57BA